MAKSKTAKAPPEPIPDHPLARCIPRGDRVVVRRDMAKTKTDGGILLPDTVNQGKQQLGTVWSVGPGNYDAKGDRMPLDLHKGQRVIVTGYAGLEVRDPINAGSRDDEFVMLREEDVLAYFPDDK